MTRASGYRPATPWRRLRWRLRPVAIALTAPLRWLGDRRARRRMASRPLPPRDGPPPAGVREPRRPYPTAGAGAAALPLPPDD